MPVFHRLVDQVFRERRLVQKQVNTASEFDVPGAGTSVRAICQALSRTRRTQYILRLDRPAILQPDDVTLLQTAEQRALRNAQRVGAFKVKASRSRLLVDAVAQVKDSMNQR